VPADKVRKIPKRVKKSRKDDKREDEKTHATVMLEGRSGEIGGENLWDQIKDTS